MIREHEVPAWHRFCLKVALLVIAVAWVSFEFLLGCRMSKQGIRSLVIVVLLMIPVWVAAIKFVASLWEAFHG